MTDNNDDEQLKPDAAFQRRFNIILLVLMVTAGVLFFKVEPTLFESGMPPVLGDVYNLSSAHIESYNISESMSARLAFQSDFYLLLFFVMLGVALLLPVGASRRVMIQRFLLDYSVKCRMEFYLPYLSTALFLGLTIWICGYSFADYEANSRTGFIDAALTKIAPFLAVLGASMIAAIFKGLVMFRLVLRELGAPKPDIANVPHRYILPWGLKKELFSAVMERARARFPDQQIRLFKHGPLPWGLGSGLALLALYNMFSGAQDAAPFGAALIWFVMGLMILPLSRRVYFDVTGQSISLATRIGVLVCLLLLSSCFLM